MSWRLFRRDDAGAFALAGVDDELLDAPPPDGLTHAHLLTVHAPSVRPDRIAGTEQALGAAVAAAGGRLVATVRHTDRLLVLAYAAGDRSTLLSSVPAPRGGRVEVVVHVDPDWAYFDEFRPRDMEVQSMDDLDVVDELYDAGDVGGVRPVVHHVDRVPSDVVDALTGALRAVGYRTEVASPSSGAVGGSVAVTHDVDPTIEITGDSWTVRLIAERFGAVYAGWGCEILR